MEIPDKMYVVLYPTFVEDINNNKVKAYEPIEITFSQSTAEIAAWLHPRGMYKLVPVRQNSYFLPPITPDGSFK